MPLPITGSTIVLLLTVVFESDHSATPSPPLFLIRLFFTQAPKTPGPSAMPSACVLTIWEFSTVT